MKQVIVIGGGAAGMMAAIWAARSGNQVTILEKNEKLGKNYLLQEKAAAISRMAVILVTFFCPLCPMKSLCIVLFTAFPMRT